MGPTRRSFRADDSRNTDNAWLETSVCCYIQRHRSTDQLDLDAVFPDSSSRVNTTDYQWYRASQTSDLLESERDVVRLIANRYRAYW